MNTPIYDFLNKYKESNTTRFHMPGHKGRAFLGCEQMDITEIDGADSLYEADGIIRESEENAAALFGTGKTLFSTEGSSQCIRAMLYLAMQISDSNILLAARNVHKTFIYGAALIDAEALWIPSRNRGSLCEYPIDPKDVEECLKDLQKQGKKAAAVYVTSPDYLGNVADIAGLSKVCKKYDTLLLTDNAHGAYLNFIGSERFIEPECLTEPNRISKSDYFAELNKYSHPMALGADMTCDSAHKTLPAITGAAYLHISKNLGNVSYEMAKEAMALFGSTSPSYLIMASLDLCNRYIAGDYRRDLSETINNIFKIKEEIRKNNWHVLETDPLKLTIEVPAGDDGRDIAGRLRKNGIECEYADCDYVVMMVTPQNSFEELEKLVKVLGRNERVYKQKMPLPSLINESVISVRKAVFSRQESIAAEESIGRISASPTVACPPAVPIVISGERITAEAVEVMKRYGIDVINVVID